ncbi:hypothetical protein C1646_752786 [Rhizophagus diaphanus]|nr:hypothetical protein C1646_752786 [Rhizophagus diaphanus] [Rhizophagus sp. MUCL 43196]
MPPKRKAVQLTLIERLEPVLRTTAGHFAAECLYCEKKWPRGRPQDLQVHFAKNCLNVDDEIRRVFIRNILRLCDDDDDIIDDETLLKPRQDSMDQSLIKIFVCCGIPFSVVKHPFFIEMFKKACSSYTLPSRDKLSGIILSHLAIKFEDKIDTIFKNTTNLTLDLSIVKHTAQLIAEEIEKVLKDIGPNNEKYPFIFNTRYVAHCVNLITKDILDYNFSRRILTASNEIVKFFKKSHQGKALLEKYTKDLKIEGGGLKSWVETRWTTMFESADSIWHLKLALEKVANENSVGNLLIICHSYYYPGYRGERLKQGMWTKILAYAQDIWKNMGYDINDQEILIAQMLNFKDKQEKTHTDNEVQKMVNESFFFDEVDYNEDNNNEDGYEEIFETQIPNHEVYVLIEDNVNLINAIFLNNEEEEEDEIYN